MTESAPIPFLADRHHAALVARLAALRRELDDEVAARGHAETELGEARELVHGLQRRLAWAETDRDRLVRALGSRLLQGAAAFVVAGLAGGFLGVIAVRWAGW
jgi:hypothetical protein